MKDIRIGMGYDIHRLAQGRKMMLGGVEIPFDKGTLGHSDGDVLLHALCDAVLGASGKGDIGMLFADTDPANKDVPSRVFTEKVMELVRGDGYTVSNIDCTVVAEKPKLTAYRRSIADNISEITGISPEKVNIKGKTAEKTDDVGAGNAIEAYAVVLLERKNKKVS